LVLIVPLVEVVKRRCRIHGKMLVGIGRFLTRLKRCCCVLSGCELTPPEVTMRIKRVKRLFAAIVLGLPSLGLSQAAPPDLVLFNGKIFTSNARQPYVEALAIRGDRIVAVGASKEILASAGEETKRIDLSGRTVIPGINDAHLHFGTGPDTYDLPISRRDANWQEIKDAISAAVVKVPKGTWIRGAMGDAVLDDPKATRGALDQIAPDHPVMLNVWGAEAAILNTAAFRKLGVRDDQPNPEGGVYARNPHGELTGATYGFAMFQTVRRYSELATDQEATLDLADFFQRAVRLGITSVQDMANSISAQRCAALLTKAPPPIRVRVIWFGLTDEHGRLTREGRGLPLHPVPLVTVSGTKWILDGTPIDHSGALREPYSDRPTTSGELNFSQHEMEEMLRESLRNGDQLMVHVAGDRTAETFLNAMDATGGEKVWSQRRIRIEHGDGLLPDLVQRAKRLGIIVVQNPIHFTLPELFYKRFGGKRAQQLQPLKSLLDAGIPVAIGSDGPDNPYLNIMLASTFSRNPSQAMTREQAVTAYTLTSAYAEFAEKEKGSLEPGKLADLAVLSQDIFTAPFGDLSKTESVMTVVGGKIVYDAKVVVLR
jgi:predicted amidohydrolase YtcJ